MLPRRKPLAAALASGLLLLPGATPAAAGPGHEIAHAIDNARGSNLSFSRKLAAAATAWARHLFQVGTVAHSARVLRAHEGEILEMHSGGAPHVQRVVREWLHSSEHRSVIMMGRWHRIGVGSAVGRMNGRRARIWVVRFAR